MTANLLLFFIQRVVYDFQHLNRCDNNRFLGEMFGIAGDKEGSFFGKRHLIEDNILGVRKVHIFCRGASRVYAN